MSVIDNVSLRIIDPSFEKANFRAEFRLPQDSVFHANLRLLNVGITSNQTDSYNPITGASGAIKAIYLYDGAELLDSITNMNAYNAWKNINKTNDANVSQARHLNYVGLGFQPSGIQSATAGVLDLNDYLQVAQNPVADSLPKGAWISLQSCFSFLRNSMIIPTNLFRQFRVVVEYNDAAALKENVRDRRDATLTTNTGVVLLADEVAEGAVKEEMKRGYNGVVYHPYEYDSVVAPAITTAATDDSTKVVKQSNNFLLHGFNNKKLKRLLISAEPLNNATYVSGNKNTGYGQRQSVAGFREALQVRINGVNKLAGAGLGDGSTCSKNRRLAMLTDTWGDVNVISGQNFTQTADFNSYVGGADVLQKTQGQVDWSGMIIEEYINDLQIFYDRHGVQGNAALVQSLRIHCMGEVEKAVVVSGGRYRIVYSQ